MDHKTEILKDIKKQLIIFLGNEVKEVILFGSQLKNTSTIDSDFDVLILVSKKKNWEYKYKVLDICYDIDLKYGILIDPHILSEEEMNSLRGRQPIFQNAIKNGLHA